MEAIEEQELQTTESSPSWQEIKVVLKLRDFRLLWMGQGISMLGDQFYLIALPWLVLQLTGDAFAMGIVLALAGIPRALFMLFGGALTDRFSPRTLMLVTNLARMALVGLLSLTIFTGSIEMWMVYLFALFFGLADAFFYPAASAIVPTIVPKKQLQIGNSITQGTAQLSVFLGPVLAGLIIAAFAGDGGTAETGTPDLYGIGVAFALNALAFLASAVTFKLMSSSKAQHSEEAEEKNMWQSILEGLSYVWHDDTLRMVFIVVAAIAVFAIAPIYLGVPVIADDRLENGAAAFGIIMSIYGVGTLIGTVLSGILPRPPARLLGSLMFGVVGLMGFMMMGLAFADSVWFAGLMLGLTGILKGWVMIQLTTWLQLRSPEALLGRIMGLLMFAFVGLAPVANALFGWLIEWNVTTVLLVSGIILALISFGAAFQAPIRAMGTAVAPTSGD